MTKGAKRPARKEKGNGEEKAAAYSQGGAADTRRLTLLIAKLILQHEDKNLGDARDDNFTVTLLNECLVQALSEPGPTATRPRTRRRERTRATASSRGTRWTSAPTPTPSNSFFASMRP
ncbi:unnamed protein product [Prorocentrum cordatum]|uniref:Uncharacterized protein n=1 Tax=Prorocentrum cordatum TaxID=2364126 RepID=A0ABN9Q9R8_9DINO|nr:unnamed protein product [Polarella glacialis]